MNESLAGHRVGPCKIRRARGGGVVTGVARVPRPSIERGERVGKDRLGWEGKEENEQRQAGRQPPPAQFNPTLLLDALEVEGH